MNYLSKLKEIYHNYLQTYWIGEVIDGEVTPLVRLPNDSVFIFCFKKAKVINDTDCDYYEHNIECDKNDDGWGRTHPKKTMAGYYCIGDKYNRLNECDYCCTNHDYTVYQLSEKALKRIKKAELSKKME